MVEKTTGAGNPITEARLDPLIALNMHVVSPQIACIRLDVSCGGECCDGAHRHGLLVPYHYPRGHYPGAQGFSVPILKRAGSPS